MDLYGNKCWRIPSHEEEQQDASAFRDGEDTPEASSQVHSPLNDSSKNCAAKFNTHVTAISGWCQSKPMVMRQIYGDLL